MIFLRSNTKCGTYIILYSWKKCSVLAEQNKYGCRWNFLSVPLRVCNFIIQSMRRVKSEQIIVVDNATPREKKVRPDITSIEPHISCMAFVPCKWYVILYGWTPSTGFIHYVSAQRTKHTCHFATHGDLSFAVLVVAFDVGMSRNQKERWICFVHVPTNKKRSRDENYH